MNCWGKCCNFDKIKDYTPNMMKRKVLYCPISEDNTWRVTVATDLLGIRNKYKNVQGFGDSEINNM